ARWGNRTPANRSGPRRSGAEVGVQVVRYEAGHDTKLDTLVRAIRLVRPRLRRRQKVDQTGVAPGTHLELAELLLGQVRLKYRRLVKRVEEIPVLLRCRVHRVLLTLGP